MIRSRWTMAAACGALMLVCLTTVRGAERFASQAPSGSDGWNIPAGAAVEASPEPASPEAVERGRKIYAARCQRCHGADGRGHGPDSDPDHPPADLTDGRRASRNPDGVMFYKIWNGRSKPKMPAMKTDMTRTDVWLVILYVKTLRK